MSQQYPPYGQQPQGQQGPYGQQPAWQAPQGQQPWQGQQGGWSPGQPQGFPPPPPPKSKVPVIITAVAAAVVVSAVILVVVLTNQKSSPSASPGNGGGTGASSTSHTQAPLTEVDVAGTGDCIKVNSASRTDADLERIDCTSPDAVYKVGKRIDGDASAECPSDSYDQYTQAGHAEDFTLCLMLNASEGDCFANITSASGKAAKVSCTASDAEGKVTKVVEGAAAESACPDDTGLALVYPEPGETVCLVQVDET